MKRILITTLITLVLTTSCQVDTFHMYKDEIRELLQDPKTRKIQGNEDDIKDLTGCPWLFKIEKWEHNGRYESWFDGRIYHRTGVGLDLSTKYFKNIKIAINDKLIHVIYIGPWHQVTLTHIKGSFFSRKTIEEKKQIRFFAYYSKEGGNIQYQYESMTSENKNIPEKKFSLSPTAKIAPDRFRLCVVKWTARFGYNAVAEVKYPGLLNKIFGVPVPTGKVIEEKE